MTASRIRAIVLIAVALALALGGFFFGRQLRGVFSGGEAAPPPAFVGSASCAECHAAESEAWGASHHALAMQPATSETVLGNFDDAVFVHRGDTTRFFRQEGRYWVRTAGENGAPDNFPVTHTFGVDPLQQYLIPLSRGRLQALSVAWDSRPRKAGGQRWFTLYPDERIAPGDPLHWAGRDQNWNYMCAECHVTGLSRGYDAETASYDTRTAEERVSCESCHGPGEAHLRWARGGRSGADSSLGLLARFRDRRVGGWVPQPDSGIARRAPLLASHEELEACAPCHSRRRVIREGRLPSEPLLETHVPEVLEEALYFADGRIHGEVYEYGSFLQSRMFEAGVTCGDCHEPHSLALRAQGNELCGQCHEPARYDTPAHTFHRAGSEASLCVSCHMPERTFMEVDRRRDHSFRVPHPELTRQTGAPSACADCHGDRGPEWAAREIARRRAPEPVAAHRFATALHSGRTEGADWIPALSALVADRTLPDIVRATALRLASSAPVPSVRDLVLRQAASPDPLVRLEAAVAALSLAPELRQTALVPLLSDSLRAVRVAAGRALAALPAERFEPAARSLRERAIAECVAAERVNEERPEAHLNLGNLYVDLDRPVEAEAEFRLALSLGPEFVPAAINLADLWRTQGRDASAESLLTAAEGRAPDSPDALFSRGLARVRLGRDAEAREDLARAARLRPDDMRLQTVYGLALHGAGETQRALVVLREAHRRRPGDPGLLYVLATLHRDLGRRDDAARYARALLELDTTSPTAQALVAELTRRPSR